MTFPRKNQHETLIHAKKTEITICVLPFFDSENHPNIVFKSTEITKKGNNQYDMMVNFTIREPTKPVTFDITFEEQEKDLTNNEKVADFSGQTTDH